MSTITSSEAESLVREQFRSLRTVSSTIGINEDCQRRALRMTAVSWTEWSAFLVDGPLPVWLKLSILLQTLDVAIYRFAVLAEREQPSSDNVHVDTCKITFQLIAAQCTPL